MQTKNRRKELIKSRAKTATWLFGSLLWCLLIVPMDGGLVMGAIQQNENAELIDEDIECLSAAPLVTAEEQDAGRVPTWDTTGVDVAKMVFFMAVFLTAYSLLTAGKRGRGWIVVSIIAAAVTFVAKGFLSTFVEVTRESCPPDWDE